jgi:hypothetical protein
MMANEIKVHIIDGTLGGYSNDLNENINTWLREHRNAKIIEIQYTGSGSYQQGSVLIIYQ